jgi:hypothetical protein
MTKEEQKDSTEMIVESFVKAREFMAEAISHEDIYQVYVDNIAMALWDGYMGKEFTTSRVGCNKAAKRILSVIFNIDER